MRIISPIDKLSEVVPLLDAGASEVYGGFVPPGWSQNFSLYTSINQRTFAAAQIEDMAELEAILSIVHERQSRFSLTLNSPYYSDEQIPALLDYVFKVVVAGVDGLILADLGLLRQVRAAFPDLELHASTLAHLANSEAVAVFADAGINRIVLPRHLPVSELSSIIATQPQINFDAFLLVGNCPNTEGLCTFHHSSQDRIWPCEIPYEIEAVEPEATVMLQSTIGQQRSWSHTDRRHGCGLCAIPDLQKAGVFGVKLVGRGAPAALKVRNVLLAREFIELATTGLDETLYREKALAAHKTRFGQDCSANVCYYPEYRSTEDL